MMLKNKYIEIKIIDKEELEPADQLSSTTLILDENAQTVNANSTNKNKAGFVPKQTVNTFLKKDTIEILAIVKAIVVNKDNNVFLVNKTDKILIHTIGIKKINDQYFIQPENIIGVYTN